MSSTLIYALIFLSCIFSVIELSKRKGYFEFLLILTAIFVYASAIRNIYIVPDTIDYYNFYAWVPIDKGMNAFSWNISKFETGFAFLMYLVKRLGFGHEVLFGVIALIQLAVYLRAMMLIRPLLGWKKNLWSVYFSIWCGYWGLFYGCIVLRSGLAISFMFLAHALILRGKRKSGIFYGIIAILFHRTIIIYPVIIIMSKKLRGMSRERSFYLLLGVMFAWVLRLQNVLLPLLTRSVFTVVKIILPAGRIAERYVEYASSQIVSSVIGVRVPLLMTFFLMVRPRNNEYYDYMLGIFTMNFLVTFFTSSVAIGGRLNSICLISMLPMMIFYLMNVKFRLLERNIVCTVFIVWQFMVSLEITGIT